MKKILFILFLCILIFSILHAFSIKVNAAPSINLTFNPASSSKIRNEIFTAAINANNNGNQIISSDIFISFNPQILEAIDITEGNLFQNNARKMIDNTNGRIEFSPYTMNAQLTHGTFAIITFKGKNIGISNVSIDTNRTVIFGRVSSTTPGESLPITASTAQFEISSNTSPQNPTNTPPPFYPSNTPQPSNNINNRSYDNPSNSIFDNSDTNDEFNNIVNSVPLNEEDNSQDQGILGSLLENTIGKLFNNNGTSEIQDNQSTSENNSQNTFDNRTNNNQNTQSNILNKKEDNSNKIIIFSLILILIILTIVILFLKFRKKIEYALIKWKASNNKSESQINN